MEVVRGSLVAGVGVDVLRLSSPFAKGAQGKPDSLRMTAFKIRERLQVAKAHANLACRRNRSETSFRRLQLALVPLDRRGRRNSTMRGRPPSWSPLPNYQFPKTDIAHGSSRHAPRAFCYSDVF